MNSCSKIDSIDRDEEEESSSLCRTAALADIARVTVWGALGANLSKVTLTNIIETKFKWPMNSWPKDRKYKNVGVCTNENFMQGIQGISLMLFTNVLGWTAIEVEVFVDVRIAVKDRGTHAYWPA